MNCRFHPADNKNSLRTSQNSQPDPNPTEKNLFSGRAGRTKNDDWLANSLDGSHRLEGGGGMRNMENYGNFYLAKDMGFRVVEKPEV